MKLEEYEKLEQLKKDLDLGESWKIGYAWDTGESKRPYAFKKLEAINHDNPFICHSLAGCITLCKYVEEIPKPKAPKYRPFKNYAEFVKYWPSERRGGMYLKSGKAGMAGPLDRVTDSMNYEIAFRKKIIITEEQVINEDYENGIPFGVLEE